MKKIYMRLSMSAALLLMLTSVVLAQERTVSGKVTDETGAEMPGVNVLLKGSSVGTATDADGAYQISVPGNDATLVFTFIGYASTEVVVGSRTTVDINLATDVRTLTELVVTGYTTEKKADIIGAVAVVNSKELLQTPTANLSQMIQGRAAGVVSSGAGAPGEGAKIRIRGFSSFSGSNPLYVIDGVPTTDANRVNPNDIESIQVLKDATAASIYGSRAAGGVIIVTTKQGKAGKISITYNGFGGVSYIPKSYHPDVLNTNEYAQYLKISDPDANHPLFGNQGNLDPNNLPAFYVTSKDLKAGFPAGAPEVNPDLYSIEDYGNLYQITPVSQGTDWFDAVTRNAGIQNHYLQASGGSENSTYSVAFNYFDQKGVYVNSGYKRYSVRVNTSFKPNAYIRIGENLQILNESFQNATGNGARGEASAWAQAFRMVPYIPVYDIQGGWGGNGIGSSGNGTNPVAQLYRDKNDKNLNYKMFGNVFAEVDPIKNLTLRTSFGVDMGTYFNKDYVIKTYERAENTGTTALNQTSRYELNWIWTNTLVYSRKFGDHGVKLLAGTEAIKNGIGDGIVTQNVNTFDFEDPDFVNLRTDQGVGQNSSTPNETIQQRTLFSVFGRIDYAFKDKYLFNATLRRDGSSAFGKENTYGVFPAFGVGWRISDEAFMQGIEVIDDLKLRGGWGQVGNQAPVLGVNQYVTFISNPGASNYDINRTQGTLATGYTAFNANNPGTKWETSESTNIGFDATLLDGKFDMSFSYFNVDTKDLLVTRQPPPLGGLLQQPQINLGKMRNRGVEFNITNRGTISESLQYDLGLTFTHFTNTAIDLDGNPETFYSINASRLNNVWRTQAGHPISSFYGYQIDGFFNTQADLDALEMEGERIGSWKFKDLNGDQKITDDDRTFIGNPQPKFIMGLNLGFRYKGFDLSTFLVWNYGNELFNYTKYWTDMRVFVGGVSTRVLYDGWTPENNNATLPQLGSGASDGYTPFIRGASNDYYVEDGSFLRGRTIQLGYTIPSTVASKVGLSNVRIYIQGQNYFTVTNYSGPDPDISIQGANASANNQNGDLRMGLDDAAFPNPRQVLVGLNLSF
jgi:TonB-linked SusC/RagA family outer membrane protein